LPFCASVISKTETKRFAASYTPTTVVLFRDSPQWAPVSVGVETLERVEEGVYRALRLVRGEVAPDQYSLQEFNDGGPYDPRREAP
jgi:conjugal transfer pilus assembly protein TraF